MASKPTCTWEFVGLSRWAGKDKFSVACKPVEFRTVLPAETFSYCPYCGKWMALIDAIPAPETSGNTVGGNDAN